MRTSIFSALLCCLLVLCSHRADAIRDGNIAEQNKYPYTVSIHQFGFGSPASFNHSCGATLVGPRHILTAGHCVDDADALALARVVISRGDITEPTRQILPIKHINFPRQYFFNSNNEFEINFANTDLALVELAGPVNHDVVNLGDLPLEAYLNVGEILNVVGWGGISNSASSTKLKEAEIVLVDPDICHQEGVDFANEHEFCIDRSSGIWCSGDSGGPLFIEVDNQTIQVGLVSRRSFLCSSNDKGVATRIGPQLDWITRQQRVSYAGYQAVRLGVNQPLIKTIDIANHDPIPLPLGVFTYRIEQQGNAYTFEVIEDECSGETLATGQSCNLTIQLLANEEGHADFVFESNVDSDVFADILGVFEMVAFTVHDVSDVVRQGAEVDVPNPNQLFYSHQNSEQWQVVDGGDNSSGSAVSISLEGHGQLTLATTFEAKGNVSAKLKIDSNQSASFDYQFLALVDSKVAPIGENTYFLSEKTDGFINIDIELEQAQSEVTFILFHQGFDMESTLSIAELNFEPEQSGNEPAPAPTIPPDSTGGGTMSYLLMLLGLIVFMRRHKG